MKITKFLKIATIVTICTTLVACDYQSRPTIEVKPLEETTETTYPKELEKFYTQKIKWHKCEDTSHAECAKIKAPLDYDNPNGETINLEAKRIKAKNPIGTMFINPGGPGGSGIDFVETWSDFMVSSIVKESYDLIGFDPRGVGKSTPVKCYTDAELDRNRLEAKPITNEESFNKSVKEAQEFAKKCEAKSGNIYKYINTISVAKDLDIWRHLAGDNFLNYFGYSYGTSLGATYIDLFPNNTGRMVLDGVVDTQISLAELNLEQAKGFEQALNSFSQKCIESKECPFSGKKPEEISKNVMDLIDSLGEKGIKTENGRRLNSSIAFEGIAAGLYNEEIYFQIQEALQELVENKNGELLLELADSIAGRDEKGHYDNSSEAFQTIDILDYSSEDLGDQIYAEIDNKILTEAPLVGKYFAGQARTVKYWPVKSTRVQGVNSEPKHKILIVGTDGDPATPYNMAVNVANDIQNSYLLTWKQFTHGAYGSGSSCIQHDVDNYLLTGILPKEAGKVCK